MTTTAIVLGLYIVSWDYTRAVRDTINSTELLSNQGENSSNFYFIMVPLRKKY